MAKCPIGPLLMWHKQVYETAHAECMDKSKVQMFKVQKISEFLTLFDKNIKDGADQLLFD